MGLAMHMGKHIFVDRKNHTAALASMDEAKQSLEKYPRSIMIFPEGTRSPNGNLRSFKKGGVVLSIQTKIPIAPLAITGTFNVMKKGSFYIKPKPIFLKVGSPIETSAYRFEDRHRVTEILYNEVVNLRSS